MDVVVPLVVVPLLPPLFLLVPVLVSLVPGILSEILPMVLLDPEPLIILIGMSYLIPAPELPMARAHPFGPILGNRSIAKFLLFPILVPASQLPLLPRAIEHPPTPLFPVLAGATPDLRVIMTVPLRLQRVMLLDPSKNSRQSKTVTIVRLMMTLMTQSVPGLPPRVDIPVVGVGVGVVMGPVIGPSGPGWLVCMVRTEGAVLDDMLLPGWLLLLLVMGLSLMGDPLLFVLVLVEGLPLALLSVKTLLVVLPTMEGLLVILPSVEPSIVPVLLSVQLYLA